MNRIGVIMLNMGGPDRLEDVRPYLENIFLDPAIIPLPLGFLLRKPLARFISRRRAPKSAERYAAIGNGSPMNAIAFEQAKLLESALADRSINAIAAPGMRYWHPFCAEVFSSWKSRQTERLLSLSLYPFYCRATSGSSLDDARAQAQRLLPGIPHTDIRSWHDQPWFVELTARLALETHAKLSAGGETAILFTAHSVPQKLVDAGDPYRQQVEETCRLVCDRLPREIHTALGYQSDFGPVKWLEPKTKDVIAEFAGGGVRRLAIVPLGFVAENIETKWDIELDQIPYAASLGITAAAAACPNTDPAFISGLAGLIERHLEEGGS